MPKETKPLPVMVDELLNSTDPSLDQRRGELLDYVASLPEGWEDRIKTDENFLRKLKGNFHRITTFRRGDQSTHVSGKKEGMKREGPTRAPKKGKGYRRSITY